MIRAILKRIYPCLAFDIELLVLAAAIGGVSFNVRKTSANQIRFMPLSPAAVPGGAPATECRPSLWAALKLPFA